MEAVVTEVVAKKKNVPVLRFPNFEDEWKWKKLGELCEKIQDGNYGGDYPKAEEFVEEGVPFLTSKALGEDGHLIDSKIDYISLQKHLKLKKAQLKLNDVLFTNRGSNVGAIGLVNSKITGGNIGPQLTLLRCNQDTYYLYLKNVMLSSIIQRQIMAQNSGSAMNFFGIGDTSKFKLPIPTLQEQEKIASFLESVNFKIQQINKKKNLLEKYKKGVAYKIFSQQIRFKNENGQDFSDWQDKKFGNIFDRIKSKNIENNKRVLTISAQNGLISQEEYFNKSVSSENVTGYYLLHKGDFAYNKSYSKGYPMGAIKRLKLYDKGVVSPLYICFKVRSKDENLEGYYEQYFESGFLNKELHKIAQEGARNHGLLNMSIVEFFNDMRLSKPSIEEQAKIASFLTAIDDKIDLVSKQLYQARQFKKGLLQQLFA